MSTITAANSIVMISVEGLFNVPQQLQGFSADDVTDTDSLQPTETMMGVDGRLSGGWVPVPIVQSITLQADSLSNLVFERWYMAQQSLRESYIANGSILLPATGRKYTMTRGFLTVVTVTPQVKKVLQPRKYSVTWESITAAGF